jgi:hypothetical protein
LRATSNERPLQSTEKKDQYQPAPYPHGSPAAGEAAITSEQPKPEVFARYTRALRDEQEPILESLRQVWIQNLLFLSGHHWWRRNKNTGEWGPVAVPEWRERPYSNLSLAHFKTWLSKALKNRPVCVATAASSDPKDIQSAELADQVIRAKQQEIRWGRVLSRAVAWAGSTGTGWLMPYWNTETGRLRPLTRPEEVPVLDAEGLPTLDPLTGEFATEVVEAPCDENGEPYRTEDGQLDLSREPAWVDEGDVGVRAYSPFQVYVDPSAEVEEDITWVLIADVMTLREITQRWPEAEVTAEDVGQHEHYDQILSGVVGGGPDTQLSSARGRKTDADLPKALVLYYYERQSTEYPEGRHWITAGKEVLLEGPTPLPDGVWPVVYQIKDIDMPGRFHGIATLESAVGLNREYNELNAWIKEAQKKSLEGAWVYEKGTGIKPGQLTNEPNLAIEVNTGFLNSIKHVQRAPVPADVFEERKRVAQDFETVSGIHRISMGRPPAGVTSGVAFLQLQEADDSDMGPFLERLEETVADVWHACLQIIKERYTEDRLIRVAGPDKRHIVRAFSGSDLQGVHDVIPQTGSAFPWSRVAQTNIIMELGRQMPHLFTDPDTGEFDRARFAEMIKIGGLEAITDHDVDVAEALREESAFEEMGMGAVEVPQVTAWQNHTAHIRCHEKRMKGADFHMWPPLAQQALIENWMTHKQEIQRMQMEAAMMAAGAMPALPPGGSGDPSVPLEDQVAMGDDGVPPGMHEAMTPGMDPPPAATYHPGGYA